MPFVPDTRSTTKSGFIPDKKSWSGFAGNIGSSAVNTVKGIGSSLINVFNPDQEKNTIVNLGKLGVGAAQLLDPTEGNQIANTAISALPGVGMVPKLVGNQEQAARNVGDFYSKRYGIGKALQGDFSGAADQIGNTIYTDPVGVALDASAVLGGAGALAEGAAGANEASSLARIGRGLNTASEFTDPIRLTGRGVGAIGRNVFKDAAPILDQASEVAATKGLGKAPKKLTQAAERAGTTVPKFMDEYNLYNRSPEAAAAAKEGILGRYDEIGIQNPRAMQTGDIVKAFDQKIAELQNGPSRFSDSVQKQIVEMTRRRDQILQSIGGTIDESGQLTSVPLQTNTAQTIQFRRGALDPDIPQSMFGLDPHASGTAMGAKESRNILRRHINAASPELEKLGNDYGVAKNMEDYFKSAQQRSAGRQNINFSRLGGAGVGGVVAGIPGAAAGFVTEQIANSPQFAEAASKGFKGAANFTRNPGVQRFGTNVGNVASTAYQTGKISSKLLPSPAFVPPKVSSPNLTRIPTAPQQAGTMEGQSKVSTSPNIVSQPTTPVVPKNYKPAEITYKAPKNPFRNSAAFGKVPRVRLSAAR